MGFLYHFRFVVQFDNDVAPTTFSTFMWSHIKPPRRLRSIWEECVVQDYFAQTKATKDAGYIISFTAREVKKIQVK